MTQRYSQANQSPLAGDSDSIPILIFIHAAYHELYQMKRDLLNLKEMLMEIYCTTVIVMVCTFLLAKYTIVKPQKLLQNAWNTTGTLNVLKKPDRLSRRTRSLASEDETI
jgi:hypothetical protein